MRYSGSRIAALFLAPLQQQWLQNLEPRVNLWICRDLVQVKTYFALANWGQVNLSYLACEHEDNLYESFSQNSFLPPPGSLYLIFFLSSCNTLLSVHLSYRSPPRQHNQQQSKKRLTHTLIEEPFLLVSGVYSGLWEPHCVSGPPDSTRLPQAPGSRLPPLSGRRLSHSSCCHHSDHHCPSGQIHHGEEEYQEDSPGLRQPF